LNAQEARARAVIDGQKIARTPRFVRAAGGARILDERALARARRVAGLKGYVTNIPATVMTAPEVIASYHDLWHVEQSFRMSKTDLQARPIFARTRDAIEAHLTIVFTALAISRTVQDRTGQSIRKVLRDLRPLRSATIEINGAIRTYPPAINSAQQALLDAITNPTAPRPPSAVGSRSSRGPLSWRRAWVKVRDQNASKSGGSTASEVCRHNRSWGMSVHMGLLAAVRVGSIGGSQEDRDEVLGHTAKRGACRCARARPGMPGQSGRVSRARPGRRGAERASRAAPCRS
jgi:hypothetical protein